MCSGCERDIDLKREDPYRHNNKDYCRECNKIVPEFLEECRPIYDECEKNKRAKTKDLRKKFFGTREEGQKRRAEEIRGVSIALNRPVVAGPQGPAEKGQADKTVVNKARIQLTQPVSDIGTMNLGPNLKKAAQDAGLIPEGLDDD